MLSKLFLQPTRRNLIKFSKGSRYFSQSKLSILNAIKDPARKSTIALTDHVGTITYGDLDKYSTILASSVKDKLPSNCHTIAGSNFSNRNYVITMLAIWKLGKRFLPLAPTHPKHEVEYFLQDSQASLILYSPISTTSPDEIKETDTLIKSYGINAVNVDSVIQPFSSSQDESKLNSIVLDEKCGTDCGLIVYTSGTTGKPKGCLHPTSNINHMIDGLVESWKYTSSDRILHFLPLHHIHGILNKLLCILQAGGTVDFCPNAKASTLWRKLAREGNLYKQNKLKNHNHLSLFMAVPTVYAKLLEEARQAITPFGLKFQEVRSILLDTDDESISSLVALHEKKHGIESLASFVSLQELKDALYTIANMRLTVSGSAALPDPVLLQWKELTGHTLLERYGMTEIGMALSNPLVGERVASSVGFPLPNVVCKIVDDNGVPVPDPSTPGELRIKVSNHYDFIDSQHL